MPSAPWFASVRPVEVPDGGGPMVVSGEDRGREAPVLVTGAGGFAGGHLRHLLEERGVRALASTVRLPDREGFRRLLSGSRPRAVVHLAAVSFLPTAEKDPEGAVRVNVHGTASVLEALRDADPEGEVGLVFASTSHVYDPRAPLPFTEDSLLGPRSVYGRSKLAAELLCRIFSEAEPRRPLWVFRAFNHAGPGQRPDFAASSFARQVALMEAGKAERILYTGNLSVRRDFCDVRDVARAYASAAAGDLPPGTYNLASGRVVSLDDLAEAFRRLSRVPFEVRQRLEPGRSGETEEIRGSPERAAAAGWRAEIPLERTLEDTLLDWRRRVAEGPWTT